MNRLWMAIVTLTIFMNLSCILMNGPRAKDWIVVPYDEWKQQNAARKSYGEAVEQTRMRLGQRSAGIFPEWDMATNKPARTVKLSPQAKEYQVYLRTRARWERNYKRMWGKDVMNLKKRRGEFISAEDWLKGKRPPNWVEDRHLYYGTGRSGISSQVGR